MAIPTTNLITYLDFLDPSCFTNGGTAVNDLSAANNDWTILNTSYTYNATYGSISIVPGNRLTSNLQNLLGDGNLSFSISFWNYFDSTQRDYLYYNGNYPSSPIHIVTDNTNSKYEIVYGPGLTIGSSTSVVTMNTWHNVTYVYDNATGNNDIYIDNNLLLSFVYNQTQGGSGTYQGVQFSDYWNATGASPLALIYFYTRAITSLEVTDLYNEDYNRFFPTPTYSGSVGGRQFAQGFNSA
jgi:hypothetical protein